MNDDDEISLPSLWLYGDWEDDLTLIILMAKRFFKSNIGRSSKDVYVADGNYELHMKFGRVRDRENLKNPKGVSVRVKRTSNYSFEIFDRGKK